MGRTLVFDASFKMVSLYVLFSSVPKANRLYLSPQLSSELEGIELQSSVNLQSNVLNEGKLMVP